jgi:hypothetical protein
MIEEANFDFDGDFSHYDDGPVDPFPDDPNYSKFLQARAKTERLARRLFSRGKIQPPQATRRRLRSNRTRCFIRRLGQRLHQRARRCPRVARRTTKRCSSGVGNEPDGDPAPPPCPWQSRRSRRNKKSGEELSSRPLQFGPVLSSLAVQP